MISQELAAEIWHAHRDLAAAKRLLSELTDGLVDFALCEGDHNRRVMELSLTEVESIVKARIAQQDRLIIECNERARQMLNAGGGHA